MTAVIRNSTARTLYGIEMRFALCDHSGKCIDVGLATLDHLAPKQRIELIVPVDDPRVENAKPWKASSGTIRMHRSPSSS